MMEITCTEYMRLNTQCIRIIRNVRVSLTYRRIGISIAHACSLNAAAALQDREGEQLHLDLGISEVCNSSRPAILGGIVRRH